jgi:hypothetical protein
MIRFSCPTCHAVAAVPDDRAGKRAVVDLTGNPDPKVPRWFRDDGTGAEGPEESPFRIEMVPVRKPDGTPAEFARENEEEILRANRRKKEENDRDKKLMDFMKSKELPAQPVELDASLKAFLHEFQTRADQL